MNLKNVEVKSPFYLFLIVWACLLIINGGIPILSLDFEINNFETNFQANAISFLYMTFNFPTNRIDAYIYGICWFLGLLIFTFISKCEMKIAFNALVWQVFIFIFSIIFMIRFSPIFLEINFGKIIFDFSITSGIISILFVSIWMKTKIKEEESLSTYPLQYEERGYIVKCPKCGIKYNSNPKFCYICSEKIDEKL
ncbi:MAG: hypothetical protein GY870_01205 [archaeon]|nr:hypothetical protein [archaeon]